MKTPQLERNANLSPIVHLVRHGRIPNHRADHPLTVEGEREAFVVGQQLAAKIRPGETIGFYASPTRRTRQTAELLQKGLVKGLSQMNLEATLKPLVVDDRLRNLQFYLDELSYDPIQPLFDAARWRLQETPSPQYAACIAFQTGFWNSPDPMGYWLSHPGDAVEAPEAVAGRIRSYIARRLAGGAEGKTPRRDICVAHSANLRAFLQSVFGTDPGEPPYCAIATIRDGQVHYQQQTKGF